MAEHKQPSEKRAIVKEYLKLCLDLKRADAADAVAEKYGIHSKTVTTWAKRYQQPDVITHEPADTIYNPFNLSPKEVKVELTREVTTEVFLSDVHWHPEHKMGDDPAAYACALELLKALQPDILYFGGDIIDAYAPSRYEKNPRLATPEAFKGEIAYAREKLKELCEAVPNARKIWLTGNHELRMPRSVATNAPWLKGYLGNLEGMVGISEFEIEMVEDGHNIGKLHHFHGHNNPGAGRVNTAKNKFERILVPMIFGHHHKFARWYQRDMNGGYFGAFANGCLQWLATDYAENPDWTQGFSVIQHSRTKKFKVDDVLIHKPSVWSPHAELIHAGHHVQVNMQ